MALKTTAHKVTPYVVMDFETGGLEMDKCGLTEIAMMSFKGDTLEKIGEYETLIAPHQIMNSKKEWVNARYDEGAFKVTGLSIVKLKQDGKEIEEVVKEVQQFLTEANIYNSKTGYKPVLIAHNAQFEVKCLQNLAYGRFDLSKYFHGQEDFFGNFAPHYIDTLDLAKQLWAPNTRMTSYELGDVLDRAGIPIFDAHRAMNDVRPSAQFFEWIVKMLRAADRGGILNTMIKDVDENGVETTTDRTFKFQFPKDDN
jgi:DNA polymerase III epsilon subunit-like protein